MITSGGAAPADGVERTAKAAVGRREHPRGEVAAVDVLQRHVPRAGGQHVAAALHPAQPPRHPADDLVRPEDEARPGQQRAVAEGRDRRQLAAPLGGLIIGAVGTGRIRVHHW
jgi:hypothetical protein